MRGGTCQPLVGNTASSQGGGHQPASKGLPGGTPNSIYHNCCTLILQKAILGTYLVVEWLRLHASTAKSMSLIPGWGTKILHATQHDQEKQTNKTYALTESQIHVYYKQILLKVTFCFLYHLVKSLWTLPQNLISRLIFLTYIQPMAVSLTIPSWLTESTLKGKCEVDLSGFDN